MRLVLQAAMTEEITPLLERAEHVEAAWEHGKARAWQGQISGHETLFVESGIGLANAAIAATLATTRFAPQLLLAVGTCGGLCPNLSAGDTVVGDSYLFAEADATIFGYARGQVPGMPTSYEAAPAVLQATRQLQVDADATKQPAYVMGQVISGDSFIHRGLAPHTRNVFPAAVAVDMESAAVAQACTASTVPFCSVRTVSDMCDWTEAEAQAADSAFLSLIAQDVHGQAAPQTRREYVYDLAANQLLTILGLL